MRWPPRTPSPSWSRRSGGWPVRRPARRRRSRRCARGTTTRRLASRRSTGTTRPRRMPWSRPWCTTLMRWCRRSEGVELEEPAASAVALLALVAGQDVEPAEGSDGTDGRWRIARKVAEDRVISTVDPDARHTRKSPENRRDGYRAHVAAEPQTGIITDEALTRAAGTENSDPAVAERLLATGIARVTSSQHATDNPTSTLEWYGDSAYGTGELRDAIARAGQVAVLKPKPLQAAVQGGFTVDDFTVDEMAATVTCPNGLTRPITPSRNVTFGAACRHCPLRQRCTTSN